MQNDIIVHLDYINGVGDLESPLTIKYKNDENFKTFFINQCGIQVGYDADGHVVVNKELQDQLFAKLSGMLHFILDNVTLPKNATIIDVGAGNSLIDLALSMYTKSVKCILVDGDEFNTNLEQLHTPDFKPYNSWQMVRDAIELSNLEQTDFLTESIEYNFSEPADVILSSYSWGLHYPIGLYLDKAINALKPGGYLILNPVLNINGYLDEIDKRLTRVVTEPEGHWMRTSHEWARWEPLFKDLPESEPTAYRCIWQKPLV